MIERKECEHVVELHRGLCFDDFGRAVTSLLEDLLYRTSHLDLPVKQMDLVRNELTSRNKLHLERLTRILRSVERLASSGLLVEVVLLQGSTVPLAQAATHIRVERAPWDDNTPRSELALRQSMLHLFRAVASADLPIPRCAKSFLFLRLLEPPSLPPRAIADSLPVTHTDGPCGHESASSADNCDSPGAALRKHVGAATTAPGSPTSFNPDIEGFERRPGLPVSRAKCRTVFHLRQEGGTPKRQVDHSGDGHANEDREDSQNTADQDGVWLQLVQHLPSVSCV